MTAEVQTTCPGCQRTLSAACAAVDKPIRCRRCRTGSRIAFLLSGVLVLTVAGVLGAGEPKTLPSAANAPGPTYARDILPLVNKYCIRCHATAKPKGGVSLDRDKNDA